MTAWLCMNTLVYCNSSVCATYYLYLFKLTALCIYIFFSCFNVFPIQSSLFDFAKEDTDVFVDQWNSTLRANRGYFFLLYPWRVRENHLCSQDTETHEENYVWKIKIWRKRETSKGSALVKLGKLIASQSNKCFYF